MNLVKCLWIDDVRPAPKGWIHLKTVEVAIDFISNHDDIAVISLDHDAGDYGPPDYIEVLKWMEEKMYPAPPIRLHSMNVVGVQNMRAIIQRNGWTEVF